MARRLVSPRRGAPAKGALALAAALAALLVSVAGAGPAAAHGGAVIIDVQPTILSGGVTFAVHVRWEDGDDAAGQVVAVTATGPAGPHSATLAPTDALGITSAALPLEPGTWSVTFAVGGDQRVIEVAVPTPTTVPPTTIPPTTVASTAESAPSPAPSMTVETDSGTDDPGVTVADDDGGAPVVPIAIGAGAVVAVAGLVLVRRSRSGSGGS